MQTITIAVIGVGKISIDQHLPVIGKSDAFTLAAVVSQRGLEIDGVPTFRTPAELYAAMPELDAVAINTPPSVRHAMVREAIDAGKMVLMEKPPATTLSEFYDLKAYAEEKNQVLYATWHSRHNTAVEATRDILARGGVRSVRIDWRESVRKWHPGQDWVWEPGGFGVCDPGINAMSIFTRIMPMPVFVERAVLSFPSNRHTPVDVDVDFKTALGADGPRLSAGFNWLEESGEIWTIAIETGTGQTLELRNGGAVLLVDGDKTVEEEPREYEDIYVRFAELCRSGGSEVDGAPLALISDMFLLGEHRIVEPFQW